MKVGSRTKLEWYKREYEEYGHNVRNTVTKRPILDFWKLKIKFKKIKKNEYISLISIRDIEKTTSHSRQKSKLLNRIKQEKEEFRHTKQWNILQKSGQKIFKTAFVNKIYLFFQKLNTKKWLNFYWNKIKVPHVPQNTISSD